MALSVTLNRWQKVVYSVIAFHWVLDWHTTMGKLKYVAVWLSFSSHNLSLKSLPTIEVKPGKLDPRDYIFIGSK